MGARRTSRSAVDDLDPAERRARRRGREHLFDRFAGELGRRHVVGREAAELRASARASPGVSMRR